MAAKRNSASCLLSSVSGGVAASMAPVDNIFPVIDVPRVLVQPEMENQAL